MRHTNPPYHILVDPDERNLHPLVTICAGEDRREHIVCNSVTPEDARFIVTACNSRDRLVEALKLTTRNLGAIVGSVHYHDENKNVLLSPAQFRAIEEAYANSVTLLNKVDIGGAE